MCSVGHMHPHIILADNVDASLQANLSELCSYYSIHGLECCIYTLLLMLPNASLTHSEGGSGDPESALGSL